MGDAIERAHSIAKSHSVALILILKKYFQNLKRNLNFKNKRKLKLIILTT